MNNNKFENKKLWIISELFSPDQTSTAFILNEISDSLALSREVEVICGPINYDKISNKGNLLKNSDVKITRIKSPKLNKNNLFLRTLRFIMLSIQLSLNYLRNSKKDDHVLIVTNPAPLLIMFALIARFSNRNISLLIHDVFPENTIPSKIFANNKSLFYKLLKNIFDHAYSEFNTLIVLGRDMKSIIDKKLIPNSRMKTSVVIIENWADIDEVYPITVSNLSKGLWGLSNKFVFLFAGNLGRNQGLEELFDIISKTQNSFIHFVIIGDGALREKLISLKENSKLENITIGASFLRSEQCNLLNACDAGIVSLAAGMEGLGVPSKSYNIMAAGKPILYFGDENSEISLLVKEHKIGWSFNTSASLLEFLNNIDENIIEISKEMGLKARQIAEGKYSKSIILNKFKEIL